ncbi:DUF6798 domain-containing protein [Rhodopirellula halodulae]|uniref:DUF6798 domain-containing protein n=1 Tax=Rhodopirellula halodulae TaxID=2894198 RepID=UPI003F684BB1
MGGTVTGSGSTDSSRMNSSWLSTLCVWIALLGLCFIYAGDAAPGVNEAHYLVKAKNFWQPDWCSEDLFASSGKAHATYYWLFGWPTKFCSLATTAWIGRIVGWGMLAVGLLRLTHSLRMPAISSLPILMLWILGIEHGNLAGEWVVGGTEAKVPAYGLVLLGLSEITRRRWSAGWIWFGAAAGIHVLTGGWSVVAAAIAFWIAERSPVRFLNVRPSDGVSAAKSRPSFWSLGLFIGGGLSLLGVLPAAAMSWGVPEAEQISAARIYAYFRISHHLMPAAFHVDWYVRHALLTAVCVAACGWLLRRCRHHLSTSIPAKVDSDITQEPLHQSLTAFQILSSFAVGAMCISLAGLVLGLLPAIYPDQAAKWLRFYWFRLADAVTPLTLACVLVRLLCGPVRGPDVGIISLRTRIVQSVAILALVLGFAWTSWNHIRPGVPVSVSNRLLGMHANADYAEQQRTMRDWLNVCWFIRASTPEDAILLTPRHQQTFKWYAHRAEVVNWKDTPQDAGSLREWAKRFLEVYPARLSTMRVTIRYDELRQLRRKYGCDWIVVDRRVVGPELPLVQIYPADDQSNSTYAVYELP